MNAREVLNSLFEAWRHGDALRASAHFALDATYREAKHGELAGRDAIVAHFTAFFRDGPRWRFEVDDVLVDGERAAVRYHFAVESRPGTWDTHEGCALVAFTDGTIQEWREYEG